MEWLFVLILIAIIIIIGLLSGFAATRFAKKQAMVVKIIVFVFTFAVLAVVAILIALSTIRFER